MNFPRKSREFPNKLEHLYKAYQVIEKRCLQLCDSLYHGWLAIFKKRFDFTGRSFVGGGAKRKEHGNRTIFSMEFGNILKVLAGFGNRNTGVHRFLF